LANSCPSFIPGRLQKKKKTSKQKDFLFKRKMIQQEETKNVCPYSFMNERPGGTF
jgi:hypothetical protein